MWCIWMCSESVGGCEPRNQQPPSTITSPSTHPCSTVPVELCLSFSFFFFLHFQGLKMRPRVASLLLRRIGGVWTPVTRQPVLSTLCWSTNSTTVTEVEKKPRGASRVVAGGWNGVMKELVRVCRGEGSKAGKQGKDGGRGGRECVAVWMWDEAKNHQMCKSRWAETENGGGRETGAQLVSSPYWINHDGLQVLWTNWIRKTNLIRAHSLVAVTFLRIPSIRQVWK